MIHLLQLLCPNRHAIAAVAWDDTLDDKEKAVKMLGEMLKRMGISKHCGICGNRDLRFEDSVTKFKTMAEAYGPIKQTERDNLESRKRLDELGWTRDIREQNKRN